MIGDWRPQHDEEGRPIVGVDVIRDVYRAHLSACHSLERNPFFSNVFLTVGDWRFHVWRTDVSEPLISSSFNHSCVRCARWSPRRPGVFFVGYEDGAIEVWDIIDQSSKYSLRQEMGNSAINFMEFWKDPKRQC